MENLYESKHHFGKKMDITTVLRDLASQENCDGEPYDAMVFAAIVIDQLREIIEAYKAENHAKSHELVLALAADYVNSKDPDHGNSLVFDSIEDARIEAMGIIRDLSKREDERDKE